MRAFATIALFGLAYGVSLQSTISDDADFSAFLSPDLTDNGI